MVTFQMSGVALLGLEFQGRDTAEEAVANITAATMPVAVAAEKAAEVIQRRAVEQILMDLPVVTDIHGMELLTLAVAVAVAWLEAPPIILTRWQQGAAEA